MSKPNQLLVDCPCCHKKNFTLAGLRRHWCFKKAQAILAKDNRCRLTTEEYNQAVNAAMDRPLYRKEGL